MKTYTRRRSIYSTRIPRHGKAKQKQQLIQKLKRHQRFRFRDQDAFPWVALFTEASIHAHWNHAHRKPNRRLMHATTIIIMTGHDEMTVHCQASLNQNRGIVILTKTSEDHANVMSQAKRIRYATSVSKIYQIFFLYRKNISLPSGAYIMRSSRCFLI